jgi:hypothetical protein
VDLFEVTSPVTPGHEAPVLPTVLLRKVSDADIVKHEETHFEAPIVLLRKISDLNLVPGEDEHAHLEDGIKNPSV